MKQLLTLLFMLSVWSFSQAQAATPYNQQITSTQLQAYTGTLCDLGNSSILKSQEMQSLSPLIQGSQLINDFSITREFFSMLLGGDG